MKHYSESELDKTIKETVCEMVESVTPPPLEESWARFEKKLKEQQKTDNHKRKRLLYLRLAASAGVIIMLTGAFAISVPGTARAIGEKILYTVETLLGGTQMNISTGYRHNEPAQLSPANEGFTEIPIEEERIVSLEEAITVSPFPVTIPEYIPASYTLEQVKFQPMSKPVARISLNYNGPDANYIVLEEMNVPEGYVQGYGYDIEDAVTEEIEVGKNSGQFILFKHDMLRMTWINNSVLFTLEGKVLKEEAIKIAESMK